MAVSIKKNLLVIFWWKHAWEILKNTLHLNLRCLVKSPRWMRMLNLYYIWYKFEWSWMWAWSGSMSGARPLTVSLQLTLVADASPLVLDDLMETNDFASIFINFYKLFYLYSFLYEKKQFKKSCAKLSIRNS